MKTELLIEIISIAIKYGYPVVSELIKNINKESITNEDIVELIRGMKSPEEYFK